MPTKPTTIGLPKMDQRLTNKQYDEMRRSNPATRLAAAIRSSSRWQRVRALHLQREPNCRHCKQEGKIKPAKQVDHIVPVQARPDLAFSPNNLQSLCIHHHAVKSAHERQQS